MKHPIHCSREKLAKRDNVVGRGVLVGRFYLRINGLIQFLKTQFSTISVKSGMELYVRQEGKKMPRQTPTPFEWDLYLSKLVNDVRIEYCVANDK